MTGAAVAKHRWRSIRLAGYDYAQAGAYFVTICTHDRMCLFGTITGGEIWLNNLGKIVKQCWDEIPAHFPNVLLDEYVVMPNHVHGIIMLVDTDEMQINNFVGARHAVPLQEQFGHPIPGSIPTIMRSFKSAVTKRINEHRGTPGTPIWHRNYYEHVIRNEESLNRIREYIITNPMRWEEDKENPSSRARGRGIKKVPRSGS